LLGEQPDMLISGINHGANLGDDVLYSGTVAAAMEGRFLGIPAIAVSLVLEDGGYFATAADFVRRLVQRTLEDPLPADAILNVNVPDRPPEALNGVMTTRLGFRHKSEPVVKALDPKNRPIYWIGPAGAGQDAGPGTDFHAVAAGCVSVSPIKVDLTAHAALETVRGWFDRFR
jgi:5'-nucleotidase